eukprot:4759135-Pleurochrysis_carterae.AAC.1
MRTHAHTHARTRTHTHARTHTPTDTQSATLACTPPPIIHPLSAPPVPRVFCAGRRGQARARARLRPRRHRCARAAADGRARARHQHRRRPDRRGQEPRRDGEERQALVRQAR